MPAELTPPSFRILRRLPTGAEVGPGGVHFRVLAPAHSRVEIHMEAGGVHRLIPEDGTYHSGLIAAAGAGDCYRISLDECEPMADPMSRYQPEGPHGPSMIVDPSAFAWRDQDWTGPDVSTLVVYEMHVGTFTQAGTWRAAIEGLPALAELGVTCIEMMPIADFTGEFGWGYDGVCLFAPSHLYGTPDDLRALIDAAHGLGLAVILDVVYNHLGPEGSCIERFAPTFTSGATEWGNAINFDGAGAAPVREFFVANAHYWVDEFHFDGLRLDAVQAIRDQSGAHILKEITAAARRAAGARSIWIVAEHEPQHAELLRGSGNGGVGIDALWNDDFHHTALVAATGRREAYYKDYTGSPQEFISAAKYGFLFQGQWYEWQQQRRGTSALGVPPDAFVCCLQNHDQVANGPNGARLHELTSRARLRALTAVLLLGPWVPMLFQGQEYAADSPFLYFADHRGELADAVREGRRTFLAQFRSQADAIAAGIVPDPDDPKTFRRSKLAPETAYGSAIRALHASLLQLRASERAFRAHHRHGLDGAVLGAHAFVLRFFVNEQTHADDRLLVVNLGPQLDLPSLPEPLLASPAGTTWTIAWSSEDPLYGGPGIDQTMGEGTWTLAAESATVLAPVRTRGAA
jgi:maltooligosyltrehalose trehalohydrolase